MPRNFTNDHKDADPELSLRRDRVSAADLTSHRDDSARLKSTAGAPGLPQSFIDDRAAVCIYQVLVVMQKSCRVFIPDYSGAVRLECEGHERIIHHIAEDYPAVLIYQRRIFINYP